MKYSEKNIVSGNIAKNRVGRSDFCFSLTTVLNYANQQYIHILLSVVFYFYFTLTCGQVIVFMLLIM